MLQSAIETEVDDFLAQHVHQRDARGNRLAVSNGYCRERELLTGAGRLAVEQPRVRDNSFRKEDRVRFSSSDPGNPEIGSERFNRILTPYVYSGDAVVAMATPAAFAPTFVRFEHLVNLELHRSHG